MPMTPAEQEILRHLLDIKSDIAATRVATQANTDAVEELEKVSKEHGERLTKLEYWWSGFAFMGAGIAGVLGYMLTDLMPKFIHWLTHGGRDANGGKL